MEEQIPVYKFRDEEGIGLTYNGRFPPLADSVGGELRDYENPIQNYGIMLPTPRGEMGWDEMREENYLKVTVYNIEVEDFHTYYASRCLVPQ